MDNQEVLEQLQKGLEGNVLGLGSVAEMLQNTNELLLKMSDRLEKAEDKDNEKEELEMKKQMEEDAAKRKEEEKEAMVKSVVSQVMKQLIDLRGNDPVDVSGKTSWPMDKNEIKDDIETPVKPRHATDEVQRPIQSMQKHEDGLDEEDEEVVDGAEEYPENTKTMYPMKEDEYKEYPNEMKMLMKELRSAKKEIAEIKKSFPDLVKSETQKKLSKMGYREEKTSRARQANLTKEPLGLSDTPIIKSEETLSQDELVEKLATNLSFRDLWNTRASIWQGKTDGIPQELLKNQ